MLNGYGKGAGTLLGGYIYSVYGPVVMFRWGTAGVVVSFIGLYFFHVLSSKELYDAQGKKLELSLDEECHRLEASGMISPAVVRTSPMVIYDERRKSYGESSPLLPSRSFG